MDTIKDSHILKKQIEQVTKNIILRDVLELIPKQDGMFKFRMIN